MKLFGWVSSFLMLIMFNILLCEKIMIIKMKSITCKDDDPSVYKGNISCSLRPPRDGIGLTTGLYYFRKPARDIWIHLQAFFKYGTIFRLWGTNLDLDVCAAMENIDGVPLFGRLLANSLQKTVPGLLHPCPYSNIEGFRNVSINNVVNMLPHMIPKGEYKITFRAHTKANQTFATIVMKFLIDAVDPLKSMQMGKK